MKAMKTRLMYVAAILAVFAGSTTVFAQMGPQQGGGGQWGHGPGQRMTAEQRLQHLTKQLNLSDAQQQLIKPILENETKQMQALQQDSTLSQQDRMSKMQAIHENTNSQIKPILTPDQQTKWQQMMQRHGQRGGLAPQGAPPQSQPQ